MTAYFDTSAFVPLLQVEATTRACTRFWESAESVCSTRLLHVESAAAIAAAERAGRLSRGEADECGEVLTDLWREVQVIELDETLMMAAGQVARRFKLRGYDAVHCAAAWLLGDDDVVAISGDRMLLDAWQELGIATLDPAAAAG